MNLSEDKLRMIMKKIISNDLLDELNDSVMQRAYSLSINKDETIRRKQYSGPMRSSNGDSFYMPLECGRVTKFVTNMILSENKDDKYKIHKLSDFSKKNHIGMSVYINGDKIPDSEVYIYISNSYTDVFIRVNRLNENLDNNTILFEKRSLFVVNYKRRYLSNVNEILSYTFELGPDEDIIDSVTLQKQHIMIFSNKGILPLSDYDITHAGNNVSISFNKTISGELEIFIDETIKRREDISNIPGESIKFYIGDNYTDSIYGAVPEMNCLFFVGDKRCDNKDIEQVGRVNFIYNGDYTGPKATMIVLDKNLENNRIRSILDNDYFMYNIYGPEKIGKKLDSKINRYLDGFPEYLQQRMSKADFDSIFNTDPVYGNRFEYKNENALFKEEYYIKELYKYFDDFILDKMSYLMKKYPYLIRYFLREFAVRSVAYNVVYDVSDNDVVVNGFTDLIDTDDYMYFVTVNGKDIGSHAYLTDRVLDTDVITIPGEFFSEGSNKVVVSGYNTTNRRVDEDIAYLNIPQTSFSEEIVDSYRKYVANVDITQLNMDEAVEISDLCILKEVLRSTNEDHKLLFRDEIGYLNITDNFEIRKIDENNFKIISEDEVLNDIILYDMKFTKRYVTVYPDIQEVNDTQIELVDITGFPIITNNSTKLVVTSTTTNETYTLFEGIDYTYKHPLNMGDVMTYSTLIMKRKLNFGDILEFNVLPVSNTVYIHKTDFMENNKYGLIYLHDIDIPIDTRYMSFYVNGKTVDPGNINILSNKMVRIFSEEVPFYDVRVETKFRYNINEGNELYDYINNEWFRRTKFDEVNDELFQSVDPTVDLVTFDFDVHDFYTNDVDDNVDSVNKLPNPERDTNILPQRFDQLLNAYLIWLHSDSTSTVFKSNQKVPDVIMDKFRIYESLTNNSDIVIYPNQQSLIKMILFSNSRAPKRYEDKAALLLKNMVKNEHSTLDTYKKYFVSKLANIVYPKDVPPIYGSRRHKGLNTFIGRKKIN